MSTIHLNTNLFNSKLVSYCFVTILLCSLLVTNVSAAELTITDSLVIRDVDDKPLEHGFFSNKSLIPLTPGKHVLILKYKDVFEDFEIGEDIVVKSDYFVVKFIVKDQHELFLTTSKIKNLAASQRFAKAPELTLLDENKTELVLHLEKLSDYELAKQVTKVVTTLSAPTVITKTDPVLISKTQPKIKATQTEQAFKAKVINNVDTLPMLKYWWQQASNDEKEAFLDFINKHELK